METAAMDSLLDEADFLAELGNLEQGMTTTRRSTLADTPMPDTGAAARTTPLGKFIDEPAPAPTPEAGAAPEPVFVISGVVAFGFFLLMTVVGAAGAALMFHNRFALMLSRIQ